MCVLGGDDGDRKMERKRTKRKREREREERERERESERTHKVSMLKSWENNGNTKGERGTETWRERERERERKRGGNMERECVKPEHGRRGRCV